MAASIASFFGAENIRTLRAAADRWAGRAPTGRAWEMGARKATACMVDEIR
jgi:hypothetical protein